MDYQVPQFIEVEEKIFGPLTLKQFIYLAGGIGICAVLLLSLPLLLGIILAIPVAALAGALAFYKMNSKPFIEVLEAGFNYYIGKRLYLWRKEESEEVLVAPTKIVTETEAANKNMGLSRTKLEELAWSLDVKDSGRGEANI